MARTNGPPLGYILEPAPLPLMPPKLRFGVAALVILLVAVVAVVLHHHWQERHGDNHF